METHQADTETSKCGIKAEIEVMIYVPFKLNRPERTAEFEVILTKVM